MVKYSFELNTGGLRFPSIKGLNVLGEGLYFICVCIYGRGESRTYPRKPIQDPRHEAGRQSEWDASLSQDTMHKHLYTC